MSAVISPGCYSTSAHQGAERGQEFRQARAFLNFPSPFFVQEGLVIRWLDLLCFILTQDKLRPRAQ